MGELVMDQKSMTQNKLTLPNIRLSAMNLLAMREHSAKELRQKLEKKFSLNEEVMAAVSKLAEEGLQSDLRFTEAFVAMRYRQGKGPLLIGLELKDRGVSSDLIDQYLRDRDQCWSESAKDVVNKKFDAQEVLGAKERAKRIRFLTARGFSSDNIHYALKNN
jgi:regulatory protein